MTVLETARLAAFAVCGLVIGGASFAGLRVNAALYLGGPVWRPIALHLVRLAVLAAAMTFAAFQGPGPLLAAAAGLVVARPIAVRLLGKTL